MKRKARLRKWRVLFTRKRQRILVDADDFAVASQYTWHLDSSGYPRTNIRKGRMIRLHTLLRGAHRGLYVDHANGSKTDNRRANLRLATGSQNCANKRVKPAGVTLRPYGRWQAQIQINRKNRHLGYFPTKREAMSARRRAAIEAFGEFAAERNP